MTKRGAFSWVAIFAAGFVAGVVFSAWKLESLTTRQAPAPARTDERGQRIEGLERMLAKTPDNIDALIQLGNDYFDNGNYRKAVEAYEKAVRLKPDNPDVLSDLGVSYRRLGQPDKAVAAFQQAIKLDSSHGIALFNLGIVYRDDLKDLPAALKAWETFLEKAGNSPHAVMVRPWVQQLKEKLGAGGATGG
ncbi:MAG: tetratricopeptide repeat protein [Desulfomonile sp.]|nr:tetratricopeptide repeat protein [Desulfomonile sp.]